MQVGPLIMRTFINENGELDMEIVMMLQCNNYIHSVEQPYSMESVIRVSNAMYCRYTGPEDSLKFAYENDVKLENDNYTIFVDSNPEEEFIVADVFIPRAEILWNFIGNNCNSRWYNMCSRRINSSGFRVSLACKYI